MVRVIERLAAVLAAQPGLTARDLIHVLKSEGLHLKKSEVNHYLYLERDLFRGEGYPPKWYLGTAVTDADGKYITVKQGPRFDVATEDLPGAPFFRVEQRGGRKILCLNRAHQFYTSYDDVAEGSGRTLIHSILVAYGDSELDATDEHAMWFQLVRDLWSHRCTQVLQQITNDAITDQSAGSI